MLGVPTVLRKIPAVFVCENLTNPEYGEPSQVGGSPDYAGVFGVLVPRLLTFGMVSGVCNRRLWPKGRKKHGSVFPRLQPAPCLFSFGLGLFCPKPSRFRATYPVVFIEKSSRKSHFFFLLN